MQGRADKCKSREEVLAKIASLQAKKVHLETERQKLHLLLWHCDHLVAALEERLKDFPSTGPVAIRKQDKHKRSLEDQKQSQNQSINQQTAIHQFFVPVQHKDKPADNQLAKVKRHKS